MGLTKAERKKLTSLRREANALGRKAIKFAKKVDKELERQMRKS